MIRQPEEILRRQGHTPIDLVTGSGGDFDVEADGRMIHLELDEGFLKPEALFVRSALD